MRHALVLDPPPGFQGAFDVALGAQGVAHQHGGAYALAVGGQGLVQQGHGSIGVGTHQFIGGQFAVELGNLALAATGTRGLQDFGGGDGALPFLLALVDLQQGAAGLGAVGGVDELVEGFFSAVQQARLQVILTQFIERMALVLGIAGSGDASSDSGRCCCRTISGVG